MVAISAAEVKALRENTGLPMMDCKQALIECQGDAEAAVRWLRERGAQVLVKRADRATAYGRFGIFASFDPPVGAMVELKCESNPVAQNPEVIQLANDLARQLAEGPGAQTADELLDQPSPSKAGTTLRQQKDDLFNRMREVFNVGRLVRIDSPCGGYSHNATTIAGVLLEVSGGSPELAKDVCMHVAAMRPLALGREDLDPADIERERIILREAAIKEGKPEAIIEKMVEGRLRNFFAEKTLLEQPFVKGDKETVGKLAEQNGMTVKRFVHWEIGQK
jgi:elongation factor Ts